MPRSILIPVLLAGLTACSDATAPTATGDWGGTDVSLTLTPSGGTLSYACGYGSIKPGWSLTGTGAFSAVGQHFFGGGPVPPQGHPPHPAIYAGRVDGDHLTLTVTLSDLQTVLGPYDLTRDGPPVAEMCD